MKSLRKWLILSHRYLGIGLCLLLVMWFGSGIVMIYAGGMPSLTPESRRAHLPPLDFGRVALSAADAAARAGPRRAAARHARVGDGTARVPVRRPHSGHRLRRHRRDAGTGAPWHSRGPSPAASSACPTA